MSSFFDSVMKRLRFDSVPKNNFELLESEYGEPGSGFTHSANDRYEKKEADTAKLFSELDKNLDKLRTIYRSDISKDLIIREFMLCGKVRAAIVFINGMVDNELINNFILREGMKGDMPEALDSISKYAMERIFTMNDMYITDKYDDLRRAVLEGLTGIVIDGDCTCCIADTRKYPQRSVDTAQNEKSVYGPREAFIENLRTNVTLIRRHMHTDDFVCEMRVCGDDTNTPVGILYRDGVANSALVAEVKKRIAGIKIRSAISTGIVNQLIERSSFSPLPQTLLTERPDRCASYLTEGHVVIICDGSPVAAVLPVTLYSLLSSPEDVYSRPAVGNIMRMARYLGALLSITIPGVFMAIFMYHQGFLSAEMLSTLISSRRMVFLPIGIELLMLLFVFQLIREAGMRVPGSVGQAIGIIGGLVLGQAVVTANLASSVVLILVALTGLGAFCIPDYSTQLCSLYFRLLFIIAGWLGGFLGFTCAFLLFIGYLSTLKSFGVPFLTPFAPKTYSKRMGVFRGPVNNGKTNKADYMQ